MHLVPLKKIAQNRACYLSKICQDKHGKPFKGIRCCHQQDAEFKRAASDVYNLALEAPALIKIHKSSTLMALSRSSLPFECDFNVATHPKRYDPPDYAKAALARAHLYMHEHYHVHLDESELESYRIWAHLSPMSPQEKQRLTIATKQHYAAFKD